MSHEEHDKAQIKTKKANKAREDKIGKYVIGMQYTDQFSKCHYSTTRKR